MRLSRALILAVEPVIVHARTGVLAVAEPGSPIRVGVLGDSEEDARRRFAEELEAWAELAERPQEQAG